MFCFKELPGVFELGQFAGEIEDDFEDIMWQAATRQIRQQQAEIDAYLKTRV